MTLRRLLFLAVLCLGAIVPAASAFADTEPNNALVQAEGPISGGTNVAGALSTSQDEDWYVLYVQGQQQIHLQNTTGDPDAADCADIRLRDTDGNELTDDYTTAPGTHRFFVQVQQRYSGCDPTSYTFRLDPGSAVVGGPAMPAPTPTGEPNETSAQSAGPLQGGIAYSGSLDTSNDQDWFYFYTPPGSHQLDLAATGPALDECSVTLTLTGPGGDEIGTVGPDSNYVSHITFTSADAAIYFVHADHQFSEDCIPAHWQFEIDPASSITTAPPGESTAPPPTSTTGSSPTSGPSRACRNARARVRRDLKSQRTLKRRLRHSHGARHRKTARKLRAVRRDLHRAVGQRRLHC